jgi:hypothetical protein
MQLEVGVAIIAAHEQSLVQGYYSNEYCTCMYIDSFQIISSLYYREGERELGRWDVN